MVSPGAPELRRCDRIRPDCRSSRRRASSEILIVGNDEKQGWDENAKPILREPGKDTLSVIDISKPEAPHIAATIPLMNSVVGPADQPCDQPVG